MELDDRLFKAIELNDVDLLKQLIRDGLDVNIQNAEGQTPLFNAAAKGFHLCLKELIKANADLNIATSDKLTALHIAAGHGQSQIVVMLTNAGADKNAIDAEGQTPLISALAYGHLNCAYDLIRVKPDLELARFKDGETALLIAVSYNYIQFVKELIKAGANINTQPSAGYPALHYAVENNNVEVVKILLAHNAWIDPNDLGFSTNVEANKYIAAGKEFDEYLKSVLNDKYKVSSLVKNFSHFDEGTLSMLKERLAHAKTAVVDLESNSTEEGGRSYDSSVHATQDMDIIGNQDSESSCALM